MWQIFLPFLKYTKIFYKQTRGGIKFKTPSQLQTCLSFAFSGGKHVEFQNDKMGPKYGQIERVHVLPKIQKHFINTPSFRPIVAMTTLPKYKVGKYSDSLIPIKSSHAKLLYS